MNKLFWFSSKIRFVCVIESRGAIRYRDSIYLLQANGFEDAFQAAILIANEKEECYNNQEGLRVQWIAKEILSLDQLDSMLTTGVEVYSEPVSIEDDNLFKDGFEFSLHASLPTQTV